MFMCDVTKTPPYTRNLFTVNYCLFANGDVSIRFSGKDDNFRVRIENNDSINCFQ